jgi:hypothetical protein
LNISPELIVDINAISSEHVPFRISNDLNISETASRLEIIWHGAAAPMRFALHFGFFTVSYCNIVSTQESGIDGLPLVFWAFRQPTSVEPVWLRHWVRTSAFMVISDAMSCFEQSGGAKVYIVVVVVVAVVVVVVVVVVIVVVVVVVVVVLLTGESILQLDNALMEPILRHSMQ